MVNEASRRPAGFGYDSPHGPATAIAAFTGFGLIVAAFWAWWPAGVVIGLFSGTGIVLYAGLRLQAEAHLETEAQSEPADPHGPFGDAMWLSDRFGA